MKIILINIFLLLSVLNVSAQEEEEKIFMFTDQMPEFPGGDEALHQFIESHTCYPAKELRDSIKGTVYVQFIIDTSGKAIQPVIKKGYSRGFDSVAVKMIDQMPLWKPGIQNGKKVKVRYFVPVKFKIKKTEGKTEIIPLPCKTVVRRKK